jgi:hypothetical protein
MAWTAKPDRTHAIIIGVEQYQLGPNWGLDGPASDACQMVRWLRERGVPAEQISLHIAPLDQNQGVAASLDVATRPATSQAIIDALTSTLPGQAGDLLVLFWGGHGIITQAEDRRLFFADATPTDKRNLDVDSLLMTLRSQLFAGFPHQICLVDACQNYVETLQLKTTLPHTQLAVGQPLDTPPEQFVLYAARPGQFATNLTAEKTGLFSRELLRELSSTPDDTWPPDLEGINLRLQKRFVELRESNRASQTPTYFRYRGWDGSAGTLGQLLPAASPKPAPAAQAHLSLKTSGELVTLLQAIPVVADPVARQSVLRKMRPQVTGMIANSPYDRVYLANILETCEQYSGSFAELVEAIRFFDNDSRALQAFVAALELAVPGFKS